MLFLFAKSIMRKSWLSRWSPNTETRSFPMPSYLNSFLISCMSFFKFFVSKVRFRWDMPIAEVLSEFKSSFALIKVLKFKPRLFFCNVSRSFWMGLLKDITRADYRPCVACGMAGANNCEALRSANFYGDSCSKSCPNWLTLVVSCRFSISKDSIYSSASSSFSMASWWSSCSLIISVSRASIRAFNWPSISSSAYTSVILVDIFK